MSTEKNHTDKKLGFLGSTSLVVGNMIGSGVFLLPASLAFYGGISIFGWIFSSLGALVLARVFATFAQRIPQSGGPYAFTKAGFGDFSGFIVVWGYWISLCATNAAIVIAMIGYLGVFFPALGTSMFLSITVGLAIIWALSFTHMKGIQIAGKIQSITTVIKIIPLVFIAIFGLVYMDWGNLSPFNLSEKSSFTAIMETASLTFFAFLGLECATIPSEQIEGGKKMVSKATMLGTTIAILIYITGSLGVMGLISPAELVQSKAPFADAASKLWGPAGMYLVAIGAVISTFGALNGWLLSQTQMPLAAAKDKIFPSGFGKINKHGSPYLGIIVSSAIVSLVMSLNFTKGLVSAFEFVILLSTLTALVPYLFTSASHLLIFYQKGKSWFWVTGALAFAFSLWAVIGSGHEVVFWGFILLMVGLPVYAIIKIKQKIDKL